MQRQITRWSRKQKQSKDGQTYWKYQITEYRENGRVFYPSDPKFLDADIHAVSH